MSTMRMSSLEDTLSKHRIISKQPQFRATKRQYFSLPKLDGEYSTGTNSLAKVQTIQLCKFPDKNLLNGSKGFKKFKMLEANEIKKHNSPLKKVLDSITENSKQVSKYQHKYLTQKRSLLTLLENSIVRQDKLSRNVRTISLHKPILTTLNVDNRNKQPEYSEHLQSIIFPQYKKEMQKKIDQKIKAEQQIRDKYMESLSIKIKTGTIASYGQVPQCREGCQIFNYSDKLFVIGGCSNSVRHPIEVIDLRNNQWGKIQIENFRRRSFYTALNYAQDKVLMVGGFRQAAMYEKKKLAITFQLLDLEKKNLKVLTLPNLRKIQPRYSHAACLIDHGTVLISGGRNLEKYLNDVFIIDVESGDLQKLKDLPFNSGLASHTMCHAKDTTYLFGGKTGDGELSNKMFNYDSNTKSFVETITYGKVPLQCYGHTMNYFSKLNVIMIYGGRNDFFANPFLNQVVFFHVGLSIYTEIVQGRGFKQIKKEQERPRFCFAASCNNETLAYLYGGTHLEGYSNTIYTVKVDMKLSSAYKSTNNDIV